VEARGPLAARRVIVLAAVGVAIGYLGWTLIDDGGGGGAASPPPPPPAETGGPAVTTTPEPLPQTISWPVFGGGPKRTQVLPPKLRPPFRRVWTLKAHSLLEFPPVIAYGRLYLGTNSGRVLAVDAATGKVAWRKNVKRCIASSPAVGDGVVYVSQMDDAPCPVHDETQPGYVVALDAATGRRVWKFKTGINESSPLLDKGVLYFGTWDGKVYALAAKTKKPLWTFETGDRVKGGAALARGTLLVPSYDGNVYGIDAATGEERWTSSPGAPLYATPAVAGGRVFVGSTGGSVYAYDVEDGGFVWSRSLGDAVYSSPAVWRNTVYVGSYNGSLYALDAASGDVRWQFAAEGPISGAPVVMAGNVYVSTLGGRTFGLDARTGRKRWSFAAGQYTPLVADDERAYLTGYSRLYALEPAP
jgi:outer membrane protein assembly factor BamB